MCGLFPCIPILGVFIFDQKLLREWEFKFLCETNTLGSCKIHSLISKSICEWHKSSRSLNFCVKLIRWVAAKYTHSFRRASVNDTNLAGV